MFSNFPYNIKERKGKIFDIFFFFNHFHTTIWYDSLKIVFIFQECMLEINTYELSTASITDLISS